jgi:hypothetical protein
MQPTVPDLPPCTCQLFCTCVHDAVYGDAYDEQDRHQTDGLDDYLRPLARPPRQPGIRCRAGEKRTSVGDESRERDR